MNTTRLNITLPKNLAASLEKVPNKSLFIAEAVAAKFAEEAVARRKLELAESYRLAAAEEALLVGEWDGTTGDGV